MRCLPNSIQAGENVTKSRNCNCEQVVLSRPRPTVCQKLNDFLNFDEHVLGLSWLLLPSWYTEPAICRHPRRRPPFPWRKPGSREDGPARGKVFLAPLQQPGRKSHGPARSRRRRPWKKLGEPGRAGGNAGRQFDQLQTEINLPRTPI